MLFKVQDFIKARKMARLKKSSGVCASNIPTTRSKTSATKAQKNISEDIPNQPELQPCTSRVSVKKRRYRPGSKALKEIRRYQRGNIWTRSELALKIYKLFSRDRIVGPKTAL